LKYTIVVSKDPESRAFSASVPALPGCHTWGKTQAEAFRQALDAIDTWLLAARKLKLKIPREVGQRVADVG